MSRRIEKCPTCKGRGEIIVDDWLIKGLTEEQLAKEKEEALADIVEVVRCKDCCHRNPMGNKCLRDNLWHYDEDYCSYGERKQNEQR